MAFESLAFRYNIKLNQVPERWLPLIYLYDPDLPLFPIYYFHVLPDGLPAGHRPADSERAFGYVERITWSDTHGLEVIIICNKDLNSTRNSAYLNPVINEIKERFGIANPVIKNNIINAFTGGLSGSNTILGELWDRAVATAYGNMLPFGKLWDPVMGLTRFVASWYSPGGRKSEFIQTHYFASKFGVRIQSAGNVPQVDFYLLPTITELMDSNNPLISFPDYAGLATVAHAVQQNYCTVIQVDNIYLSRFNNPVRGKFKAQDLMTILSGPNIPPQYRTLAMECFNAFDKGPQRPLIFLMMLDDLRHGRLNPAGLPAATGGLLYDRMSGTFQSPKVIHLYAQQCFGNINAMPVDNWMETFFKWPLNVYPAGRGSLKWHTVFSNSVNLGKVERLLWVVAQARKVHSSACNDAVWCIKYSGNKPRGANPLACNICLDSIRSCCPAYAQIRLKNASFNTGGSDFEITTSSGNNTTPNQRFVKCSGMSIYNNVTDEFSPVDDSNGFAPFPSANHNGSVITVEEFVQRY